MTNNINLNSVSGAIIPYTPPKSAEEFVNGEVVKKAHEIFEKAIRFQECKFLKVSDDLFLKWKYLTNTYPISESQDFFSILRDEEVLLPLFSFLDRNSLQNLSQCSTDIKEDVDQYADQVFKRFFKLSYEEFQEKANDLEFEKVNTMLEDAVKNHVPGIAVKNFIYVLLQRDDSSRIEEILYCAVLEAIKSHATEDTILSLLSAGSSKQICSENDPTNLIELALEEKIATKAIIEALISAGSVLDDCPDGTLYTAVMNGASAEVFNTLIEAGVSFVDEEDEGSVTINNALDYNASAEVIRILLDAGFKVDKGTTFPFEDRDPSSINRALRNGASFEIIKMLLDAGAVVDTGPYDTLYIAVEHGASAEVIKTLLQAGAAIGDEDRGGITINEAICFNASAEVIQVLLDAGCQRI